MNRILVRRALSSAGPTTRESESQICFADSEISRLPIARPGRIVVVGTRGAAALVATRAEENAKRNGWQIPPQFVEANLFEINEGVDAGQGSFRQNAD